MWILRAAIVLLAGLFFGVLATGVVAALPYPYSLLPLLPVCVALALVLRLSPTAYWIFLVATGVADLYSGIGFGPAIFSYVIVVYVMSRIATEVITHRSIVGCAVISIGVGVLWPALHIIFGGFSTIDWAEFVRAIIVQGLGTAFITTLLYVAIPRWWTSRSPSRVGHIL